MLKALYDILVSLVPLNKKFKKDIEEIKFTVDPYDVCVAKRIAIETQQILT